MDKELLIRVLTLYKALSRVGLPEVSDNIVNQLYEVLSNNSSVLLDLVHDVTFGDEDDNLRR